MHAKAEVRNSSEKNKKRRSQIFSALKLNNIDFVLLLITLALVAFGLIMVFSASYYYSISMTDSPFTYLIRDGVWVVCGLILMFIGTIIDYRVLYNNKKFAYGSLIVCFLLLIVLLTPIGQTVNGATRWIAIGPITIMPGELSKLGLIFYIAWFYGRRVNIVKSISRGVFPIIFIVGVFAVLIYKQPNLSTMITVCGIAVGMMLVAGLRWRYVIVVIGAGVAGLIAIVTHNPHGYQASRILSFLDPFADAAGNGYQVVQSLLALGSGGLFGVGLGKSVQKSLYLPEPQNDFILAIIGEELGFIGVILLILAYCIFIWRGARIAIKCKDQFGMLLASGITIMVAIQVLLNIAVVTSSMPATGINLPFISYGGNALIIFMFSAGVLLNISKHETDGEDLK